MKKEIKFILNYTKDKRDINSIKTDFEKSDFTDHGCVSFKVLDENKEEVSYSEFMKMTLDEIKKNNYSFVARRFLDENLSAGDFGVLKEKITNVKTNFYIIKIKAIGELSIVKHDPPLDETILEYVETNMKNRKNYKAKYICFDADKNTCFEENENLGNGIRGIDVIEAVKNYQGTLNPLTNPIMINWVKE